MPIRDFTDAGGVAWQVWATTPMRGEVRPQFASGWLAFESGSERRRLVPIPTEWEEVEDVRLCELLAQSIPVTRGAPLQPAGTAQAADAPVPAVASLELTVAKVREVIRAVDATLRDEPPG